MKLNRSTDMALRIAMVAAASQARVTVDELAAVLDLPRNHVAKVVQRLHRLGVLVTIRGRSGGVVIAEEAGGMTVGQVVRAFEGDAEVVDCDTPACPLRAACRLRVELRRAQRAFLAVLDGVRLGDLADGPAGSVLLALGLPVSPGAPGPSPAADVATAPRPPVAVAPPAPEPTAPGVPDPV